jgi:hypothetical protein
MMSLRPIYHQCEPRIEAHIFVAFLAYCLYVTLRAQLNRLRRRPNGHRRGRPMIEQRATLRVMVLIGGAEAPPPSSGRSPRQGVGSRRKGAVPTMRSRSPASKSRADRRSSTASRPHPSTPLSRSGEADRPIPNRFRTRSCAEEQAGTRLVARHELAHRRHFG